MENTKSKLGWIIGICISTNLLVIALCAYRIQTINTTNELQQTANNDPLITNLEDKTKIVTLEEEISELNDTIAELEKENTKLSNRPLPPETPTETVVVYSREGLLIESEREKLKSHLIDPIIDYHKDIENPVVSVQISVPINVGEDYQVSAILKSGTRIGFLHGKREVSIPYWFPTCMGNCEFSESFRSKYPEVVRLSNR